MPWFHLCTLIDKLKSPTERDWYLAKAVEHGWSRNVLIIQIESRLIARSGNAVTNFAQRLPGPLSDLARESLKDPYRLGEDFFIDLLFYHLKLHCYVVVELKAGAFKPEHVGKLGFYLTAIDAQMKAAHDSPTIGMLLCKSKNKVVVEYALRDHSKPMGVAEYQLVESLPVNLQTSLPSIEAIEQALADDENDVKE